MCGCKKTQWRLRQRPRPPLLQRTTMATCRRCVTKPCCRVKCIRKSVLAYRREKAQSLAKGCVATCGKNLTVSHVSQYARPSTHLFTMHIFGNRKWSATTHFQTQESMKTIFKSVKSNEFLNLALLKTSYSTSISNYGHNISWFQHWFRQFFENKRGQAYVDAEHSVFFRPPPESMNKRCTNE